MIKQDKTQWFVLLAFIIFVFVVALVAGCDPNDGAKVLRQHGYTNINMTGWRPLMAAGEDLFSYGFEATSPTGQRVTGAVTGGPLKGWTIRFD